MYIPIPELEDWTTAHPPRPLRRKDGQSYGAAMTEHKREMLANGVHPATRLPLRTGLADSCGTCSHCVINSNGNRHWYKCNLVPITNGSGTDIRLKWPACVKWERKDAEKE